MMNSKAIYSFVDSDFQAVNQRITKQLYTQVPLIAEVGKYIINSGGKRTRPLVCLLSAGALGYKGTQHIDVAAVVEFLHTATLLHDDVVDQSILRRGKTTVNAVWGNAPSVLVGDFLISRSFQMVVATGNMKILQILSSATNLIAEGEVLQLVNCKNPETTEEQYMEVINYKTAKMFEASSQSGAALAGANERDEMALAQYGACLGIAFQLIDDVLDYIGSAEEMGKNVGDDLAEGKPTLPLIHAIKNSPTERANMIRSAIKTGGLEHLDEIGKAVKECGALDYTIDQARAYADKAQSAISHLPDTDYKAALNTLAKTSVERTS